jgi:hypothetical protein
MVHAISQESEEGENKFQKPECNESDQKSISLPEVQKIK